MESGSVADWVAAAGGALGAVGSVGAVVAALILANLERRRAEDAERREEQRLANERRIRGMEVDGYHNEIVEMAKEALEEVYKAASRDYEELSLPAKRQSEPPNLISMATYWDSLAPPARSSVERLMSLATAQPRLVLHLHRWEVALGLSALEQHRLGGDPVLRERLLAHSRQVVELWPKLATFQFGGMPSRAPPPSPPGPGR